MTCREFVELVTDYLEGALSPDDSARFEAHIQICVWCERYLRQIRTTMVAVGRINESDISPAARDALLHAFHGWHAERQAS